MKIYGKNENETSLGKFFHTLSTFNPKFFLLIFKNHLFSANKTLKKWFSKWGNDFQENIHPCIYLEAGIRYEATSLFLIRVCFLDPIFSTDSWLNNKHRITWRNTSRLLFKKEDVFLKQKVFIILRIEKSMKTWLARIQKQT